MAISLLEKSPSSNWMLHCAKPITNNWAQESSNSKVWSESFNCKNEGTLLAHFIDMNSNLAADSYTLSEGKKCPEPKDWNGDVFKNKLGWLFLFCAIIDGAAVKGGGVGILGSNWGAGGGGGGDTSFTVVFSFVSISISFDSFLTVKSGIKNQGIKKTREQIDLHEVIYIYMLYAYYLM